MAEEKHYMRYWVNNDIPTNMATMHTESCPFLKNGIPSKRPADGRWYGPIPNEQVARGIAQACERKEWRSCTKCDLRYAEEDEAT